MASQRSETNPEKDDKSRQRQHGTQQDQGDAEDGGSSSGKENPGSSANDPESDQKGGKSQFFDIDQAVGVADAGRFFLACETN